MDARGSGEKTRAGSSNSAHVFSPAMRSRIACAQSSLLVAPRGGDQCHPQQKSVFLPVAPQPPHTFRNCTARSRSILAVIMPGGVEAFFAEVDALAQA